MTPTDRIRALAEPLLVAAGLRLWDVEVADLLVRVLVDKDGGVDLEALSAASRLLSDLLDEHDDLVPSGRYELEVSSPGLERTLRTPDHHRCFAGATVTVKTRMAVDGSRRIRGVLLAADDEAIRLVPDAAPSGDGITIRYEQIERTRTVLDWGPAPKPGSRQKAVAARSHTADHKAGATSPAGSARDSKDRAR